MLFNLIERYRELQEQLAAAIEADDEGAIRSLDRALSHCIADISAHDVQSVSEAKDKLEFFLEQLCATAETSQTQADLKRLIVELFEHATKLGT